MSGLGRRGLRVRLMVVVVSAVAAALMLLTAAFNLVLRHSLDTDATSLARAQATAELAALASRDGRLVVRETADQAAADRRLWVFAGARALERPPAPPAVDAAASALAASGASQDDPRGTGVRLVRLPVVQRGTRLGTIVAGVSLTPYRQTARLAFTASIVLGALVLLAVALASGWLLTAALRPVAKIAATAAEWSERRLDRRFELGPPHDEITQLGATLDGLLDRIATSLRHEQSFSAEVSHELRTPLARIKSRAQLALRGERSHAEYQEALIAVLENTQQMQRTLEALLTAARADIDTARASADAHQVALAAVHGCRQLADQRGIRIELPAAARGTRIGAEPELIERLLSPVIENACRHATSTVRVLTESDGTIVRYRVQDDGPGVPADDLERIFRPGVHGERTDGSSGAGLGLSLARRLAQAANGHIEAQSGSVGGCFIISLPKA